MKTTEQLRRVVMAMDGPVIKCRGDIDWNWVVSMNLEVFTKDVMNYDNLYDWFASLVSGNSYMKSVQVQRRMIKTLLGLEVSEEVRNELLLINLSIKN